MTTTDLQAKIRDAVADVAIQANLTSHGRRSFERMATEVVGKVQGTISAIEGGKVEAALEADRARIHTILSSPEAKGREAAALKLATSSDMSPEAAAEMLAGFPKYSGDPLGKYMAKAGTPGICSDDGDFAAMAEEDENEAAANLILNAGKNS